MLKHISVAVIALFVSSAALAEMATAKVVVYRADEATKTQRIKFYANVDQQSVGRLKYDRPVVVELEPGTYNLGSSLPGTEPLEVTLAAGATYYVHASVKKLGLTVSPSLEIVEETVAVAQRPEIAGAI